MHSSTPSLTLPNPAPTGEKVGSREWVGGNWIVGMLAFMMLLAPAIGVPGDLLLQDTLKSMLVAFATLGATLLFFWQQRHRCTALHWHALMCLPLALMLYALGSMAWSHAYLGGVEAIRWFIFSLLLWLAMNTLTRERLPGLALGIHAGAVLACSWAALQFWIDIQYFPQVANPASTFSNRNFFAEYLVCTLPFSVWLLGRSRSYAQIAALSLTASFNVVVLLMSGTRSALAAMGLLLLVVLPLIGFLYRKQFAFSSWNRPRCAAAAGIVLMTIMGLGLINTGNPKIAAERHGLNALERGIFRSASVMDSDEYVMGSSSVRLALWKATGRMILDWPVTGVGAGAWEVKVPLYQTAGAPPFETAYYAHNEFVQLLAEYGLVGWVFLVCLLAYLAAAAWKTLNNKTDQGQAEAPLRAVALSSLLALLMVSNAGFPWHLASTVALFALCLGMLAASDARLSLQNRMAACALPWKPVYSRTLALAMGLMMTLAAFIAQQAVQCERKIISAWHLALNISQSGDVNNPRWNSTKMELLTLLREGIAINPNYYLLTPMVADELVSWGDVNNAVWVWESISASRPNVVPILSNIGRGYMQLGNAAKADEYLARGQKVQPTATSVRSLELLILSSTGKSAQAAGLTRRYLADGTYDYAMLEAGWQLGLRSGDYDLAILSMELRNKTWPATLPDGLLKLGNLYALQIKDDTRALASYRAALDAAPVHAMEAVRQRIPSAFQDRL